MVEAVVAVEGFPPAFLLDQLIQPLGLEAVAVPGFPEAVTEAVAAGAGCAVQRLQQRDGCLEFTGSKALHRQLPQLPSPNLQLLQILGVSLAGLHQLSLQHQSRSLITVVPELGSPLAPAMGLLLRCALP